MIGILQCRLQRHVARDRIHHRINRSQFPFELPVGKESARTVTSRSFDSFERYCSGNAKSTYTRSSPVEGDNLLPGIDHLANIHLANTKLSVERRDKRLLRDVRAHLIHNGVQSPEF